MRVFNSYLILTFNGFNATTQTRAYYFKRLKKWRARPDYFKISVENLVQEMGGAD
jgi:hypothetical protein